LKPGGKTRAVCEQCGGAFAPDKPRLKIYQQVLGAYTELRLHVTCVSEAYAASVRQNNEGTYERLKGRRRQRRGASRKRQGQLRRQRGSETASVVSSAQKVAAAPTTRAAAAAEAHERGAGDVAAACWLRESAVAKAERE